MGLRTKILRAVVQHRSRLAEWLMADIFLSYAREDLERARSIAAALEAEGWSVFWDRRIPPGRSFEDYIEERIKASRVVMVLWSPHSVASSWVRIEAAHGRDRRPPALIPILIAPAAIPFSFQHLQAADFCAWQPGDRGVEFLVLLSSIETLAPRRTPMPQGSASASVVEGPTGPDEVVIPLNPAVSLVRVPAGIELRAEVKRTAVPMEAAAGDTGEIDLSKDFLPFGPRPTFGSTVYLASAEAFSRPGTRVTLDVRLTNPYDADEDPPIQRVYVEGHPRVWWEYSNGLRWTRLDQTDDTKGFRIHGTVTFEIPADMAAADVRGQRRFWIRARLVSGHYGEDPRWAVDPSDPSGTRMRLLPPTLAPPSIQEVTASYTLVHRQQQ